MIWTRGEQFLCYKTKERNDQSKSRFVNYQKGTESPRVDMYTSKCDVKKTKLNKKVQQHPEQIR